ncbi:unnamed protein product [Cochlearia groenlandica]
MAEEHRCETPEGHRLCVNNCGFFGSSATMNLCSNCYGDLCVEQQQQASMKSTVESSLSAVKSEPISAVKSEPISAVEDIESELQISSTIEIEPVVDDYAAELQISSSEKPIESIPPPIEAIAPPQRPNRCTLCRKRVGLTGFMCRCETIFCGTHRYPEIHGCKFDFKSAGREEIAKANPLVVAAKLRKL